MIDRFTGEHLHLIEMRPDGNGLFMDAQGNRVVCDPASLGKYPERQRAFMPVVYTPRRYRPANENSNKTYVDNVEDLRWF